MFQFLLNAVKKRVNLVLVITAFSSGWLRESHVADILWGKTRPISQRCLNELEKLVNVVFVVTAFPKGWLRESYVVDIL